MRLLERLVDDKPVVSTRRNGEPETTIMRREEVSRDGDSMKDGEPENKEVVRPLVEKIAGTYSGEQRYEGRKGRSKKKFKILDFAKSTGSGRHKKGMQRRKF